MTEREVFLIDNSLLLAIIEFCAIFFALFYTLNISLSVRKILASFLLVAFPTVFLYFFADEWVGLVSLGILTAALFYWFSKTLRVVLDLCIVVLAGILSDHISQLTESVLYLRNPLVQELFHTGMFILLFALFILGYQRLIMRFAESFHFNVLSQLIVLAITSLTVLAFYLNLFFPANLEDNELVKMNLLIQSSYFILMLMLFLFLLRGVRKENRVKRRVIEQEQFSQYMQALEQINNDMQKFRHDYTNILLTMRGYLNQDDLDGLKTYFDKHIVKTERNTLEKTSVFNQLENIQLIELKGLLATKVLVAYEQNIPLTVEAPEKIHDIKMDIIMLTRVVGILMDNAIEASLSVQNPRINLALLKKDDGSILFILENRIEAEYVNIKRLFDADYSTKGEGRGTGLSTVRTLINRHPHIKMNTVIENHFFTHHLEIGSQGGPS
ncbi:sensor histidine kinase [Planococcus maitriensis]|uniref:Sensor histidine kinase NatK-like C-terminal domain-containing protein n=1 Tax=Planococcus maitriensis TaxID=221799 RepID=A0A365K3V7_9BACL|nr:GHKL domain-containing protein [Planococcus maitriensis]RAZ67294.1 hypothetical protein DP119_11045 [Planococcus maitriensis]